ncbi:MAG: T9SS type A sorting domain-containing protein [Bacteroidia bacterium]|nr:T9SS type A sorting domain-containing protein [Bacteroidia bacterium]
MINRQIISFSVLLALFLVTKISGQNIRIKPQISQGPISSLYKPGLFLITKTTNGGNDFINNGIKHNSLRLISIETAFDYSSPSINDVMTTLEALKPNILYANSRCEKLILPIMKMPAWLSSSSDQTIIGGGWKKFNGMPPANYALWNLLVDSIVNKINGQWGLDPYYEIWNEPDIFYWQGTQSQYFNFFKNTFFAIKNNHPNAKVGGPVTSSFSTKFGSGFPFGHLSNAQLDSTIVARVIDSCAVWNAHLDFISWHKFESSHYSVKMEMDYLNQKLISTGHGIVPYLITEWNNTQTNRESTLGASYIPNYIFALEKYGVAAQSVAAWQDFEMGTTEFHKDYGLISWAALHKPEWKSLLLLNLLKGNNVQVVGSNSLNLAVISSLKNDTLNILLSNYTIGGFNEATLDLLFNKQYNTKTLESAGFNVFKLDSIYKGLITLPITNALTSDINAVKPIYQKADSALHFGRNINLTISGLVGVHVGQKYLIDSTHNNIVFRYDSLITAGHTRASATAFLYPNSVISKENISMVDSTYNLHLQPNAVTLLSFFIPGVSGVKNYAQTNYSFDFYPNPVDENLHVKIFNKDMVDKPILIYNSLGMLIKSINLNDSSTDINISDLMSGLYFLQVQTNPPQTRKFIKK